METNTVAVLRTDVNTLAWVPCYLSEDGQPIIQQDGEWVLAEQAKGFERFHRPQLFDDHLEVKAA
jgi:hypothetical protein